MKQVVGEIPVTKKKKILPKYPLLKGRLEFFQGTFSKWGACEYDSLSQTKVTTKESTDPKKSKKKVRRTVVTYLVIVQYVGNIRASKMNANGILVYLIRT